MGASGGRYRADPPTADKTRETQVAREAARAGWSATYGTFSERKEQLVQDWQMGAITTSQYRTGLRHLSKDIAAAERGDI